MNVLVTGATGFVGAHVVQKLIAQGHTVRILRRKTSQMKLLEGMSLETVIGDITDRNAVFEAVKNCDAVFHVAGFVSFWNGIRERQRQVHVEGTRHVVEACLAHSVKRLIHTSSIAAIGFAPEGRLGDETTPYNWWPYHLNYNDTKYLAELEVRAGISKGLDAVIVNPAVIFGPGDLNLNAGALVFQAARGFLKTYLEGGCCTCTIEDVAEGHLLALEKGKTGENYILGGENHSWKTLMTMICEIVGAKIPRRKLPSWALKTAALASTLSAHVTHKEPRITPELARITVMPVYYSSEKAVKELSYRISPIRDTIRRTYEWYLDHGYL